MNTNDSLILLVEDHPDDVFLTLHALRKLQLTNVVVRENVATALDYLQQTLDTDRTGSLLPKMLLVDLNMPGLNGIDFIRIIRRSGTLRTLPVVVLTSSNWERHRMECIELGITAYLNKPLDHKTFALVMRAAGMADAPPQFPLAPRPAQQKGPKHEATPRP